MVEKPAFRDALRTALHRPGQRLLRVDEGRRTASSWPYYITMADGEPMAFAGLYSTWTGPNGEEVDTAAIVTVEPNLEISLDL